MQHVDFIKIQSDISYHDQQTVFHFANSNTNIDEETVKAFGEEWSKFNDFSDAEIDLLASTHYFDIVPESYIKDKKLLDVGCGTGRWTKYVSKFATSIDAVDPSKAIIVAAKLLNKCSNVRLSQASVDNLPFADGSFDLVFSLGVLHHIPDTQLAMKQCVSKIKPGGYFLTYLYYNFDNRGFIFKCIFHLSAIVRKIISNLPSIFKDAACDFIAALVYMPFVWAAGLIKKIGMPSLSKKVPLHFYVGKSFHVIRNDARDRFGTPLEQRFTKDEIRQMMKNCGLNEIVFSDNEPYWHAIGKKG